MLSFNGNRDARRNLLQRARQAGTRAAAGEDRKKIFWSRRSHCEAMYVCKKPDCDHTFYTAEVGVPLSIAYAERGLFEELSDKAAGKWPERFLNAIPVDIDSERLQEVWRQLAIYVLSDSRDGLINTARTPEQRDAIMGVCELFESRSTDAEAWQNAARAAHRVYSGGPDRNYRLEGEKAYLAAGAMACYAASNFACAFENPRYAQDAIQWSAWAHRYQRYAELIARVKRDDPKPDERGMVNVGAALWASGMWCRAADRCESDGEALRIHMYEVYGNQFIYLLKTCPRHDREDTPGLAHWLANWRAKLHNWRVGFVRYWNEETVG